MEKGNFDLALLVAYKLSLNWQGRLTICAHVSKKEEKKKAESFLDDLRSAARMTQAVTFVGQGALEAALRESPSADLNVVPMEDEPDFGKLRKLVEAAGSSCLFAMDSGTESALA